jgi:phosphoenolpyruvate carboxykinase (GTP)
MAMRTLDKNCVFTNCALTDEGDIWWEGIDEPCEHAIDWQGKEWTPDVPRKAAHPNARFTVPAVQCPAICPAWEDPAGVPIDIVVFGGRRTQVIPLVTQAYDFDHGVLMGALAASETTAAALDVGQKLRRDPFAMLPFCGYNMADYWSHWLTMGDRLGDRAPAIFYVNWFRTSRDGRWLWPGYGENSRVLKWMCQRVEGTIGARETPIGYMPREQDFDLQGLELPLEDLAELLEVDIAAFQEDVVDAEAYFERFGSRVPPRLKTQLAALAARLG